MNDPSAPTGEHVFDLSGGSLCLDFVNTLGNRTAEQPTERLTSYAELTSFARQASAIDDATAKRLHRHAARHPGRAQRVLEQAVALREVLHRIFSEVSGGGRPSENDLAILNAALQQAGARHRVVRCEEGFEWGWVEDDEIPLERVLWPIARSAADLLTSSERAQVKVCDEESCAWLFVDRSRNRSRRWCSMDTCGNRTKARRHYARRRSVRKSSRGAGAD
jgi:predicted RNA-binding Zn ribbon-like protein